MSMQEHQSGYGCGYDWATLKRNQRMAERICDFMDYVDADGPDALASIFQSKGYGDYSAAEWWYFILNPRRDGDRNAAANFWSRFESARPADDFVEGFCRGTFDQLDLA